MDSAFTTALRATKWPAGFGFLLGVSGAFGIKSGSIEGKMILAAITGSMIAAAFALAAFLIVLFIKLATAKRP